MRSFDAHGTSVVDVLPPLRDFWRCNDTDVDCHAVAQDSTNFTEFPYCKPGKVSPEAIHVVEGCENVDYLRVAPETFSQTMFVATSVQRLNQTKINGVWRTTGVRINYVTGVEKFLLKIRHSFLSHACDELGCVNTETQGFLATQSGDVLSVSFCNESRSAAGCQVGNYSVAKAWTRLPRFGSNHYDTAASVDMCVATAWGDYITLGTLLTAAGISLNDIDAESGEPLRKIGVTLVMEIKYQNDDPKEFWNGFWPPTGIGLKWKYTYNSSKINMGSSGEVVKEVVPHPDDKDHREVWRYTGVDISVEHTSSLRAQDYLHAFIPFATLFITTLGASTFFVESVLLRLYSKCFAKTNGQLAMFDYYKYDVSLPVENFEDHGHTAQTFGEETRSLQEKRIARLLKEGSSPTSS